MNENKRKKRGKTKISEEAKNEDQPFYAEKKCKVINRNQDMLHRTGKIASKTAAGVGIGAIAGLGTLAAAALAEVTLPVVFVLKVFGFTGGTLGLLQGIKRKKQ